MQEFTNIVFASPFTEWSTKVYPMQLKIIIAQNLIAAVCKPLLIIGNLVNRGARIRRWVSSRSLLVSCQWPARAIGPEASDKRQQYDPSPSLSHAPTPSLGSSLSHAPTPILAPVSLLEPSTGNAFLGRRQAER